VDRAVLVMAKTIMTARVRTTPMGVRMEPGKGREQWMRTGNGRQLRTGSGRGRQLRKGRGRGRGMGTGKGNVLLNKPLGEKARRAMETLQGARGMGHGGQSRVGIFGAGSISRPVNFFR